MHEPGNSPAAAAPGADAQYRQLVFPPDHRNPAPAARYNLIVIGAGPAGLVTAMAAASLGAKVALIERRAMGGDCLNVGCIPSKTLLHAAAAGSSFGEAMRRVREVRTRVAAHDSVARYRRAGVDVFLGAASFDGPHLVRVADAALRARKTVIATGARPAIPEVPGLGELEPLTNESVFDLEALPRRLAILGAGPLGCELAQAFARLGARVELIEIASRVLVQEELPAARLVAESLTRDGVALHLDCRVQSAARAADGKVLALAGGERVVVDAVLVAAGRRANIEGLNLDKAGVSRTEGGAIEVDAHLRTRHPDIYAAGDVCGRHQLTHAADAHARIVVRNALFRGRERVDRLLVPHCLYTRPELARVGPTSAELERGGTRYDRYRIAWEELDRAVTDEAQEGYAEVLAAAGSDRILAATLVGRDAGEQIAPLVLMMMRGVGLGDLGALVLPYPTRSEYLRRLADAHARKRLTPRIARLLAWWMGRAR